MKKKLVTFIISIFLAVGCFTNNVHAEINTLRDLFNEYGSEYLQSSSLKFSNGSAYLYILEDTDNTYWFRFATSETDFYEDYEYLDTMTVNLISNNVYESSGVYGGGDLVTIKVTISDNKISTLELSGIGISVPADDFLNGIYYPPSPLVDILNTTPGGFPSIEFNAWLADEGYTVYYTDDKLNADVGLGIPFQLEGNTPLVKSGNDYKTSGDFMGIPYELILNTNSSGVLQKITVNYTFVSPRSSEFTAPGNRKTINMLFSTLSDKPESSTDTWVNENGAEIYIDSSTGFLKSSVFNDDLVQMYFELTKSGSATYYTGYHSLTDRGYTAHLENNVIKYFVVDIPQAIIDGQATQEQKDKLTKIRGTYSAPITVGDILGTFNNFPTTEASGWVNANGKRIYINNNMINVSYNVPLDTVLQKDGNNYKYTTTGQSCTFVMTSGVLTSINVTAIMSDFNGEYTPYSFTTTPSSISPGYTGDIEFVTNGKYVDQTSTAVSITVDNLPPLDYGTDFEVTSGSTHIKILGSFLSGLAAGEHHITITMAGYSPLTSIIVVGSSGGGGSSGHIVPNTGVK